ncbi:hypothetical protein WJX81_006619 [Elliptochloris bilobata]|uniref:Uncharacterized protein n=1 Tax=Elliptochloris bilobata TaxID=381761 RepID=A0AAW1RXP3_9CHLO
MLRILVDRLLMRSGQRAARHLLALLLPRRRAAELAARWRWHAERALLKQSTTADKASLQRRQQELLMQAEALLSGAVARAVAQARASADALARGEAAAALQDRLAAMRGRRATAQAAAAADSARALKAQERVLARRLQRQQAERRHQREAVEAFQACRGEAAAAQAQQDATAATAAKIAATAQRMRSRGHVRLRYSRLAQRQAAQRAHLKQVARARRRLDRRLEVLCAQVRVEVAADPARLLGPTACSAAEAQREARAFKPLHGFSTADILRDQRFRVLEALQQCGMHRSAYAQRLVQSVAPARHPRGANICTLPD